MFGAYNKGNNRIQLRSDCTAVGEQAFARPPPHTQSYHTYISIKKFVSFVLAVAQLKRLVNVTMSPTCQTGHESGS